jgi:hypothetical protein
VSNFSQRKVLVSQYSKYVTGSFAQQTKVVVVIAKHSKKNTTNKQTKTLHKNNPKQTVLKQK